jgi:hypothetical protein
VPLTKSSVAQQKVRLLTALDSLNNDHSSYLRACCVGVRSSSKPNLVPVRPLRPRSAAWQSSFVAHLNNTTPRHAPTAGVNVRAVARHCRMAVTTLACNFIWPYNSSVLSHCTNSFSVSPSLASKPVRRMLSLRSSYLGASARVSTARLTTWHTFLTINVVHLGSSVDVTLVVTTVAT